MITENDIGKQVHVSDGTPRPPERFNRKLATWENYNYDGLLTKVYPNYEETGLLADVETKNEGWIVITMSGVPIEKITPLEVQP